MGGGRNHIKEFLRWRLQIRQRYSRNLQKNIVDVLMPLSMRFIIQNVKPRIMRRFGRLWGDFGRMGEECLSLAEWDLHGVIRL